jgi:Lon protease-like protein
MSLPLHIFEPRYQNMIGRCLKSDSTFGVLLMTEGQEGRTAGTRHVSVGCTAHITQNTPLAHGRMNIQTIGRRRFTVISQHEHDEYLIGQCQWLDDTTNEAGMNEAAHLVRNALRRYLENLANDVHLTGANPQDIEIPDDPYWLSMWAASLLSLSRSEKQNLLELTSTRARLESEYSFLRRVAVVRQAWLQRLETGLPIYPQDKTLGSLSSFISLN